MPLASVSGMRVLQALLLGILACAATACADEPSFPAGAPPTMPSPGSTTGGMLPPPGAAPDANVDTGLDGGAAGLDGGAGLADGGVLLDGGGAGSDAFFELDGAP